MANPIAHKIVPARVIIDLNGEDHEVATFDVRLPVYPKLGNVITDEDGSRRRIVGVHPHSPATIAQAVEKSLRRATVAAVPYDHVRVKYAA